MNVVRTTRYVVLWYYGWICIRYDLKLERPVYREKDDAEIKKFQAT